MVSETIRQNDRGSLFSPCDEFFGMQSRVRVPAEHRQPFAEIQLSAKLGHCLLACQDFRDLSRMQQPVGQPLFAHERARSRKQFEQASPAKEI
jgi:hypothetical protein